jgi:hypothetical protein
MFFRSGDVLNLNLFNGAIENSSENTLILCQRLRSHTHSHEFHESSKSAEITGY